MSSAPLESLHNVVIYTKVGCPACDRVKAVFGVPSGASGHIPFLQSHNDVPISDVYIRVLDPAGSSTDASVFDRLAILSGRRTVPVVFVGGHLLPGVEDVERLGASGELLTLLALAGAVEEKTVREAIRGGKGCKMPPGLSLVPASHSLKRPASRIEAQVSE
jgi:glutaredoxin